MITLHRNKVDKKADAIEESFQDMVLAYQVETSEAELTEPYIEESGKKIEGDKEIERWIRRLESDLQWQRSLSGDGCYIDPDSGQVC